NPPERRQEEVQSILRDAEDLEVYIFGRLPAQTIAHPSSDDKRAAAGIGGRARDAASDIHRGVEIRHAEIILRAYTKRAGQPPGPSLLPMLDLPMLDVNETAASCSCDAAVADERHSRDLRR